MVGVKPGPLPVQFSSAPLPPEFQGPPPTEKEALLRRLVALLEEEADVINQKVTSLYSMLLRGQLWGGANAGAALSFDAGCGSRAPVNTRGSLQEP